MTATHNDVVMIILLTVQAFIAIVAGEVAIRYTVWFSTLARKSVALKPLILGVAIGASGLSAMEVEWILAELFTAMTHPELAIHAPLNSYVAIIIRLWIFLAACLLTLPVVLIQGGEDVDKRTVITDMVIRLFGMITSFIAGFNACVIFTLVTQYTHHQ